MQVTVQYHALLREKTGRTDESLALPAGAKVQDLLSNFALRYPGLAPLLPSLTVAVNDEFATPPQVLKTGDRIDLLPPFGGG